MKSSLRNLGLALAVCALISLVGSSRASCDPAFDAVRTLIRNAQAAGQFKCPIAATLINLLNVAEVTTDPVLKKRILTLARDCACKVTREINGATGQIFMLAPPAPDLAGWQHTRAAQEAGGAICRAIQALISLDTIEF